MRTERTPETYSCCARGRPLPVTARTRDTGIGGRWSAKRDGLSVHGRGLENIKLRFVRIRVVDLGDKIQLF